MQRKANNFNITKFNIIYEYLSEANTMVVIVSVQSIISYNL